MADFNLTDFFDITYFFGAANYLNNFFEAEFIPVHFYPLILLAVISVLVLLIYLIFRRRGAVSMHLRASLLNGSYRSFYGLLEMAVHKHFSLFHNVPVSHVIQHRGPVSPLPAKLRNGFIDLLLCEKGTLIPKCAIILIEPGCRKKRDKEIKQLRHFCDRLHLSLLVYEARGTFEFAKLQQDVYQSTGMAELLGTDGIISGARPSEVKESGGQRCEKCGSAMVSKMIQRGRRAGQQALVCGAHPVCRYVISPDSPGSESKEVVERLDKSLDLIC